MITVRVGSGSNGQPETRRDGCACGSSSSGDGRGGGGLFVRGDNGVRSARGAGAARPVGRGSGETGWRPSASAMLDALLGLKDGLTGWEVEFVESLARERDESVLWSPTMGQARKLEQVYADRVVDGERAS